MLEKCNIQHDLFSRLYLKQRWQSFLFLHRRLRVNTLTNHFKSIITLSLKSFNDHFKKKKSYVYLRRPHILKCLAVARN